MRLNILRVILIVLLAWTFIIIFNFSNENAEKSSKTSQKVTEAITLNIKSIQELEVKEKIKVIDKVESVVRKIAHFSIYTLVGFLLMQLLNTYKIKEKNKCIISLMLGAIYATSDELHQRFIPGRSGEITDVVIDTGGVICGILIAILTIRIIYTIKVNIYKN